MGHTLEHYSELVPAFMTVASLVVVAAEWVGLTIARKLERHGEGVVNVLSAALTFVPIFVLSKLFTITAMFWLYEHRVLDLGLGWPTWILAYVAFDLSNYVIHRASHENRLLWCVHSVHHQPKEMKASVSFRGSFADVLVTPHTTLWLPLLGFHPLMIVIVEGVGMIWGVFLHLSEHVAPADGWTSLTRFVITPSIHRLHHAKNGIYLDTNYGLTFSVWDRMFGTLQPRVARERPEYGLQKEVDSANLLASQTDELISLWRDLRRAPRLRDKLGHLLRAPGWSHVDGGHTARQIRRAALRETADISGPSRPRARNHRREPGRAEVV